jgi:hypothetical protein
MKFKHAIKRTNAAAKEQIYKLVIFPVTALPDLDPLGLP